MFCADARAAGRADLCKTTGKTPDDFRVLVVNVFNVVAAEVALHR